MSNLTAPPQLTAAIRKSVCPRMKSSLRLRQQLRLAVGLSHSPTTRAPHCALLAGRRDRLQRPSARRLRDPSDVAAPSVRLQLPGPINCLFPVQYHPAYNESVEDECNEWVLSFFRPTSQNFVAVRHAYIGGLYPFYISVAYPFTISTERLLLLIKYTTWLFLLDDTMDASDVQAAEDMADDLMAVLKSTNFANPTDRPVQYKSSDPQVQRFIERLRVEVWEEMCRGMSPTFQHRYVQEVMRSIEAMKEMWHLRSRGILAATSAWQDHATLEDIVAMRMLDGVCLPTLILVEYVLGIDLSDNSVRNMSTVGRLVRKLEEATCKQMLFSNEVLSCGKELAKLDAQSLVGFLAKQRGITSRRADLLAKVEEIEGILREVWAMVQEQERISADLIHQIRAAHAQESIPGDRQYLMYAEALLAIMAGTSYWTTLSARYNGPHPIPWDSATAPAYLTIPSSPFPSLNIL